VRLRERYTDRDPKVVCLHVVVRQDGGRQQQADYANVMSYLVKVEGPAHGGACQIMGDCALWACHS